MSAADNRKVTATLARKPINWRGTVTQYRPITGDSDMGRVLGVIKRRSLPVSAKTISTITQIRLSIVNSYLMGLERRGLVRKSGKAEWATT